MYSLKRDHSWLTHPDIIHRLHHGRALLREVVRAVFADRCVVGWSEQNAPFHGVMIRTSPTRILINPKVVITHDGKQTALVIRTLHGVALHEASHAVHTSRHWPAALRRQHRAFQQRTGYKLPERLVWMCANLAEDIFIEDKLAADFPGFRANFTDMRLYLFPDADIAAQAEELALLWAAFRSEPSCFDHPAVLTQACYNTTLLLVNRPACAAAAAPARVPAGLEALDGAARTICQAGKEPNLAARLRGAVHAADQLFRLLREWMQEAASTNADDVSNEETARAIEEALRGRSTTPLREDGSPVGKKRVKGGMTRKMAAALREFEEQEARQAAQEEICPAHLIVSAEALKDPKGRALLENMTARIVDSTPESLYASHLYEDLDGIAGRLLAQHRRQAEELRCALDSVIRAETKIAEYGLCSGDLDDFAVADLALGVPAVFQQTQTNAEHRLDLTLLVDESGSMRWSDWDGETLACWELAATAAILLEHALRPHFAAGGVRLRVFGFTSDCFEAGETILYRHFDSAIPRLNRPRALGWSYPKGSNADGIALAAVRREILRTEQPHTLPALLMISDGVPSAEYDYDGERAYDHVRQEVLKTQQEGVRFAHVQVGSTQEDVLTRMYGTRWQRVSSGPEIPGRVAEIAARWLTSANGAGNP